MQTRAALCSTGCFSRESNLWSIDVITRGLREVTGAGFEVIFYRGWYDAVTAFADAIVATGAATPVVHAEKAIGPSLASDDPDEVEGAVERFTINCGFARAVGARRLVLHLWGLPHSDTRLDRQLGLLPRLADVAAGHDLVLSVESLLCQVGTPVDGVARAREVDPRVGITLDTAFLAMQDQLATAVTDDRLWPGVDHVHIKDYADVSQGWGTALYLHPGEGTLDLTGFVGGLLGRGYAGSLTLESFALHEDDSPDVERIQTSLAWMRQALGVS